MIPAPVLSNLCALLLQITCMFALLALAAAVKTPTDAPTEAPTDAPTPLWDGVCTPGEMNVEHSDASKSFLWIAFLGLVVPGIFFSCKAMSMSPG